MDEQKRLGGRFWVVVVILTVAMIFTADWVVSRSRLGNIRLEASANPSSVVADGVSSTLITIRVTEKGVPRVGDLLQIWLGSGAGQLAPKWCFTDADGAAVVKYTPNRHSPYDPKDAVEIHVKDTSIGRLIEVGKEAVVAVDQTEPEE